MSAWTTYDAAVAALVAGNQVAFGSDSDLALALLLEATSSFRASAG